MISIQQIRAFHVTGEGLDAFELPAGLHPGLIAPPLNGEVQTHEHLLELYAKALTEQRGKARERFLQRVRYARDRMREILELDDSRDPAVSRSTNAVSAALGAGISLFNANALSAALQTPDAVPVERMDRARRKRCESTLETLRTAFLSASSDPLYWEFPAADGGALAFCHRRLDIHTETLRALRIARLELESAYDAAIHDETIARFTWESADAEELSAMPAIVVVDTAGRVAENSLTSFVRLLRSEMPLQILIECPPFYTGDLGFLAVSHREAFVLQSSMACLDHLTHGLIDMTHTLRPAVALVAMNDPSVFHESRTYPLYVYNPENGDDWILRFRLHAEPETNPNITAAHVASLCPAMAGHFRILPEGSWNAEQAEINDYLAQFSKQAPLSIPYIWMLDEEGRRHRAILTRELALIARDRRRNWRLLEELASAGKPEPPPVDTAKIEKDAAQAAILSVVSLLRGEASASPVAAAPVASAVPPPALATASSEAPADPYIESGLCTSCNDCMKINSRMFLYNADKQAYMGDPSAGTFAELVKAAEGCPARCIHPGTPRAGDRTATAQLIARSTKFL